MLDLSTGQIFRSASERILCFPPKSFNQAKRSVMENCRYISTRGAAYFE